MKLDVLFFVSCKTANKFFVCPLLCLMFIQKLKIDLRNATEKKLDGVKVGSWDHVESAVKRGPN